MLVSYCHSLAVGSTGAGANPVFTKILLKVWRCIKGQDASPTIHGTLKVQLHHRHRHHHGLIRRPMPVNILPVPPHSRHLLIRVPRLSCTYNEKCLQRDLPAAPSKYTIVFAKCRYNQPTNRISHECVRGSWSIYEMGFGGISDSVVSRPGNSLEDFHLFLLVVQ
ncbi:hypothetical protein F4819DRAFT_111652 [Hypoxylon fuscum]|nr:hypothetical protein F4819DRAFT_111652 [Hypoxylon fuscum]